MKLNGIEVTRVKEAIFIPLPVEAWTVALDGKCSCNHCTLHNTKIAHWDTLAVSTSPRGMGRDTTWVCHYPELHDKK